jgi:drug/metabolite transporter (DMT)-like permease
MMAVLDSVVPGGKKIANLGWVGLLVGFAGVALLVVPGINSGATSLIGSLAVLLAAFFWAAGSVYSTRHQFGGSLVISVAIQSLAGGLALSLTGLALGEASRFHLNITGLGALLYLTLVGSLAGYSAYLYILKVWPPAKAGTYAYINPPVAVLLGALVLHEPFNMQTGLATVVILIGVLLVQLSRVTPAVEIGTPLQTTSEL